MRYWLFKSEPTTFSIQTLNKRPRKTEHWDGVRNYQVRNLLRSVIKRGDLAFFYHSSCKEPGIAGVIEIVKDGYPDFTAWDKQSHHYDPKSSKANPRWFMVDVKLKKIFPTIITLTELRQHKLLKHMQVLRKGNRLSITSVTPEEWTYIINLSSR